MTEFSTAQAFLLAASEVLPAESRDLSFLLRDYATLHDFAAMDVIPQGRNGQLAHHIRLSVESSRVVYWQRRLGELRLKYPSVQMVTVLDDGYPTNLSRAYDRPPFIFVRGTNEGRDELSVAIVGSRRASDEVLTATSEVASRLASRGVTVVSGLALGVDAAAHAGALAGRGRTLAVLGHGIDQVQPSSNRDLAEAVLKHGALISQFRPFSPPTSSTFPLRNAVISGLAMASLIMDATERSGTRSEAEASLRQGRPVFLWSPALGSQRWAQEFARQRKVYMVDSWEEVIDRLRSRDHGTQQALPFPGEFGP